MWYGMELWHTDALLTGVGAVMYQAARLAAGVPVHGTPGVREFVRTHSIRPEVLLTDIMMGVLTGRDMCPSTGYPYIRKQWMGGGGTPCSAPSKVPTCAACRTASAAPRRD